MDQRTAARLPVMIPPATSARRYRAVKPRTSFSFFLVFPEAERGMEVIGDEQSKYSDD
ncbi:hypothetical protein HQN84_04730 [Pedobacter steynii]|uniref:hypothetical protein n=1 Tax=Pedobacter steynii TaxID=430522 RepID=UPI00155DDDAE|nr:hypothetical protein [Pedobacter steynii]NQX38137.1 hypothetical protein [Pedobacter steynii]